jgi:hypothetical protein
MPLKMRPTVLNSGLRGGGWRRLARVLLEHAFKPSNGLVAMGR